MNKKIKGIKKEKNIKWTWAPFKNQARTDDLKLHHWIKKDDSNINKDYEFANYNKKINLVEFNKNEYNTLLLVKIF
jgi:DNA methyltransferase 1-associated protein 1